MIDVTVTKFDNLMMIKQQGIAMDILQDEFKTWHGTHIVSYSVHKRKRWRRNSKKKKKIKKKKKKKIKKIKIIYVKNKIIFK